MPTIAIMTQRKAVEISTNRSLLTKTGKGVDRRKREKEEKRKRDSKTDLLQLANDVFEAVYLFVTVERLGGVVPVRLSV
jgi:hypothetical protein